MSFSAEDHAHMARALRLGERGSATATPNPAVGCVIARGGRILGEGWHAKAGGPHAEVVALANCVAPPEGATAYVTLEPCAHHGRTPPCVEALLSARVARVVAALADPFPGVNGEGMRRLAAAGVRAQSGLLADAASVLHRGFLSRIQRQRPWVTVKLGVSFDGRTALANGQSRWITSAAARRDVHALRARACAILTGIGTLKDDDPDLTVRDVPCARQPLRVLLDSRLEVSDSARMLQGGNTLIVSAVTSEPGAVTRAERLRERGVDVILVPTEAIKGKVDLAHMLAQLAERGINDLLVETGAKLNGSLLAAGLVDEIVAYVAPSLLGDNARGMFAFGELAELADRKRLAHVDARRVGPDWRIRAQVLN